MELTMVKAQAYLKAEKAKKSAMPGDFSESTGHSRRHAARVLNWAGQQTVSPERLHPGR
jgi:hypothetical protein